MGIDTSAMLIVGLTRAELETIETIEERIDNGEFDRCPTFYDGGGDGSEVIGYCVVQSSDYSAQEFTLDTAKIDRLKAEFKYVTGQDPKLYIAPYVR